jgi:aspartate aminotransferase-like enzyme
MPGLMKTASVKQFMALRSALEQEKKKLEARLKEIRIALDGVASASGGRGLTPTSRAVNALSLREAVAEVVRAKPLNKLEILDAVASIGYKFTARDPMMSLNTLLYTPGNFKKHPGGKWGPLKK